MKKNLIIYKKKGKDIRRHQYEHRDLAKMREVIIYKIGCLKEKASKLFNEWFNENKENKQMSNEEVLENSKKLEVDPDIFKKMMDLYKEEKTLLTKRSTMKIAEMIYGKEDSQKKNISRESLTEKKINNKYKNYCDGLKKKLDIIFNDIFVVNKRNRIGEDQIKSISSDLGIKPWLTKDLQEIWAKDRKFPIVLKRALDKMILKELTSLDSDTKEGNNKKDEINNIANVKAKLYTSRLKKNR